MRAADGQRHISGAEGIYDDGQVYEHAIRFIQRAMGHERGLPGEIHLSIEKIEGKPIFIKSLPVWTCSSEGVECSRGNVRLLLDMAGVSHFAIEKAEALVFTTGGKAGAFMLDICSGQGLETKKKTFRVSRMGFQAEASLRLDKLLSSYGLSHYRIKEALVLASKVAFADEVLCELCVSDDPSYTTGYVASRRLGYVRIPHIKALGSAVGGRVFFIKPTVNLERLVNYLESVPVLINEISENVYFGDINEFASAYNS